MNSGSDEAPHKPSGDLLESMGFCPDNFPTIKEGAEALVRFLRKIAVANDMSETEVILRESKDGTEVMYEACPEDVYHMAWAYHACHGLITCPGKWHCEAMTSYSVVFVDDSRE